MTPAHGGHGHGSPLLAVLLPLVAVAVAAAGYVLLAVRDRDWSGRRTVSFLAGCAVLAVGLTPGLSPWAEGDFRGHMLQHLLIGMVAPLGLVLAAPITLVLRSVPPRTGRLIGRALRSRPARVITHPVTALTLNVGSLGVLYFTPLYGVLGTHPLLHLHFLAAGYLFAWVITGPDPAPHRPSVPVRLVVLGVAVTVHAVLSQLMYAGLFVQVPAPADQLRGAGELMYYGGDIAEMLLALSLLATWRPRPARARPATGPRWRLSPRSGR
ncbi:putative membrane protein [Thermomonospora echinospora]|uniref:Putative membrane protein n=1 Tax=Thermomonospora echinospora TaxID=1992 RepID=A0A1H6CZY7_9ACTN|nr:cytochrome c oxidase assembly protein [Thermomonospora echinospora]SEG78344.1 putative membrane protein [Thermomonospora echinospora]